LTLLWKALLQLFARSSLLRHAIFFALTPAADSVVHTAESQCYWLICNVCQDCRKHTCEGRCISERSTGRADDIRPCHSLLSPMCVVFYEFICKIQHNSFVIQRTRVEDDVVPKGLPGSFLVHSAHEFVYNLCPRRKKRGWHFFPSWLYLGGGIIVFTASRGRRTQDLLKGRTMKKLRASDTFVCCRKSHFMSPHSLASCSCAAPSSPALRRPCKVPLVVAWHVSPFIYYLYHQST
jgi:hypothetical protein